MAFPGEALERVVERLGSDPGGGRHVLRWIVAKTAVGHEEPRLRANRRKRFRHWPDSRVDAKSAFNALYSAVPPRWDSLAGRAFWHVIGLEESRKRWAQQVQVNPERASGVLIGALGMLEEHYALPLHRHLPSDIRHGCASRRPFCAGSSYRNHLRHHGSPTCPRARFKCYYRRTLN